MASPDYCELKATELILEARSATRTEDYEQKISQAISLLVLARYFREIKENKSGSIQLEGDKEGRTGSDNQGRFESNANP